ncbi:MAG: Crp/Fnr family transcriptional regulator [Rhizobacter sp.]|nr:Crp/Fnr family transcriptional regulator [Chlorobiales bacterium]
MPSRLEKMMTERLSLNAAEWRAVRSSLSLKPLLKREALVMAGEVCRHVAFVEQGCLRCFYHSDGKEITAHFQVEGQFSTDYQSLTTQTPTNRTIEAVEPSMVVLMSYGQLQYLYRTVPALESFARAILEKALVDNQNRLASFLCDSPEERYLRLLKESPEVLRRVPQRLIASYLGITPEALSRIRNRIRTRRSA